MVAPVIVKSAVWKPTFTVLLPAPMYWHTRHQQARVMIGSDVQLYRTAPH